MKTCVALLVVLMISGCASSAGELMARQKPNEIPTLIDVPTDGNYGLFIAGETDPLLRFHLTRGEKLGFELSQAGTVSGFEVQLIYAVGGSSRFPLDVNKTYEWRTVGAGNDHPSDAEHASVPMSFSF